MGEVNIYNLDQAYFYIENGVRPKYIGVNKHKNNMVYFKFNMDETQELYRKFKGTKNSTNETLTY